nr:hypothetical protein [Angustibacter aerolatus]
MHDYVIAATKAEPDHRAHRDHAQQGARRLQRDHEDAGLMPPAVAQALQKAQRTMSGFSAGQRVIAALLTVGVLLGAVAFGRWVTAPTYAPLFSNLAGSDASAIVDKLDADGVQYQVTDGGNTILVPKDAVYGERVVVGRGPAGQQRQRRRLLAARQGGRHLLAVPAAGHLPAGARGRAWPRPSSRSRASTRPSCTWPSRRRTSSSTTRRSPPRPCW